MARPRKQTYTLDMYLTKIKKGSISNDADVQRYFVWSNEQINGLIVTVLTDDYIPPIILGEEDNSQLRIADGGQRSFALNKFRYGNYKITSAVEDSVISYKKKVIDKEGNIGWEDAVFDIKGKTYEQLPDELKDTFNEYQIETVIHEHCDMDKVSKYIKRYNATTPMNTNQKAFTYLSAYAKTVRKILNNKFFIDYSNFTEKEKTKGVTERVIVETIMCSNHLDNWKKQMKTICAYLNENAAQEEFDKLDKNLHRLENVITEDVQDIFNSKDSFLWLTLFDRFTDLAVEDNRFVDFLREFKKRLRYQPVDGKLFDTADDGAGTKDKAVIIAKLHILEALMLEYLHVNKSDTEEIDFAAFVKENIGSDVTDEDIELFEMIANDKSGAIEDLDSWMLSDRNRPSFVALVGHAVREDHDDVLDGWLPVYEKNHSLMQNQKENFLLMKQNFEQFVKNKHAE